MTHFDKRTLDRKPDNDMGCLSKKSFKRYFTSVHIMLKEVLEWIFGNALQWPHSSVLTRVLSDVK